MIWRQLDVPWKSEFVDWLRPGRSVIQAAELAGCGARGGAACVNRRRHPDLASLAAPFAGPAVALYMRLFSDVYGADVSRVRGDDIADRIKPLFRRRLPLRGLTGLDGAPPHAEEWYRRIAGCDALGRSDVGRSHGKPSELDRHQLDQGPRPLDVGAMLGCSSAVWAMRAIASSSARRVASRSISVARVAPARSGS